jgi:hypothetical protein
MECIWRFRSDDRLAPCLWCALLTENSLSRLFRASALLDSFSLDYSYNLLIRDGGLRLEKKGAQLNFDATSPTLDFKPQLSVACLLPKSCHLPHLQFYLVPTAQSSLSASPLTSASYFLKANSLAQPNTKQDAGHCRPQALDLPLGRLAQGAQTLMLAE